MKKFKWSYFYLLILFWILYSCIRDHKVSDVHLSINQDTVNIDESFIADLYLDNYTNELPEFFIIGNTDTFRLVFNDTIKSAHFIATSQNSGIKTYHGFAQYIDSLGRFKKENFTIKFVVR